ncbi:LysR family transcriptional regulator [Glaciibacter superstes]|uniref:LysR family transcriptional regulator n=1 Tax=Glaciibacter superstes TaxID=501023 RepID=UPI0003B48D48|nr:LysR family transcriptional regulator [Glaciibacter superstes]
MALSVHQLHCFIAVVDHGTVTRASQHLYISQPALSAQIRALEAIVGVALFERHAKGMALSTAGEGFLPHARASLTELDAAVAAARTLDREDQSPVRVGIIMGTQTELIARVLRTFRNDFPDSHVELMEYAFDQPSAGLMLHKTDVSFVILPILSDGLGLLPLGRPGIIAVLPVGHALSSRGTVRIGELLDEPWVATDTLDTACREYWSASAYRSKPAVAHHTVRSLDKFVQLVASNEAIGIAPAWVADTYRGHPVCFVPVVGIEPPTIALAWREADGDRPLVRRLRAVAEQVSLAEEIVTS